MLSLLPLFYTYKRRDGEMVDTHASGACTRKSVRVRLSLAAQLGENVSLPVPSCVLHTSIDSFFVRAHLYRWYISVLFFLRTRLDCLFIA
jgi:hypothetical protein